MDGNIPQILSALSYVIIHADELISPFRLFSQTHQYSSAGGEEKILKNN